MSKKKFNWKKQRILITGGTGSFGKEFVKIMLKEFSPKKIVVFSRDELKQHELRREYPDDPSGESSPMRYFIGDVRDFGRLKRALNGIDIVIHAAALKQVPTCEFNPIEAVKTNIIGGKNVIEASLDMGVKRIIMLSTDKAVSPVNLYGATKLASEKLFVQANAYSGASHTRFSCVRYGNVIGSRGSVIPVFIKKQNQKTIPITDARMTRFWITLEQGVHFVIKCIERMHGGEVFIPKIPSMSIVDIAKTLAPNSKFKFIGIRPGEKIHEILISEDEARNSVDMGNMYIVKPPPPWYFGELWDNGKRLPDGFKYTSDSNSRWLKPDELLELVKMTQNAD